MGGAAGAFGSGHGGRAQEGEPAGRGVLGGAGEGGDENVLWTDKRTRVAVAYGVWGGPEATGDVAVDDEAHEGVAGTHGSVHVSEGSRNVRRAWSLPKRDGPNGAQALALHE